MFWINDDYSFFCMFKWLDTQDQLNFTIDDEEQRVQLKGNQKGREKAKQAKNTANEKKISNVESSHFI